jgi:hypothetical protein
MRRAVLAFAVIAFTLTAPAFAEQRAAAPHDANALNGQLDYFVGRWRVLARDPGNGETMEFSYVVERTPGEAWLAGSGASHDGAFTAHDTWGRDPQTGEFMRVIFDGSGTFAIVRAPAWEGDSLVFEGDARSSGGVVRVRESITRVAPDRFEATWAAYQNGEWAVYSIETVSRQAESH